MNFHLNNKLKWDKNKNIKFEFNDYYCFHFLTGRAGFLNNITII